MTTLNKVLAVQLTLILLLGIFSWLAAPFLDNRIETHQYSAEQCEKVPADLMWSCRNHRWILLGDQIVFLPGFFAALLLPLTGIIAYVAYRHRKEKHEKGDA